MRILRYLARSSPPLLLAGIFFSLLGGAGVPAVMLLIARILRTPELGSNVVLAFVTLSAAAVGARLVASHLLLQLHQRSILNLRVDLVSRILQSPCRKLEEKGAAKLLHVLTEDVHTVSNAFMHLPALLGRAAIVLGCLGLLAFLSPLLFSITAGTLTVAIVTFRLLERRSFALFDTSRAEQKMLYALFRDLTEGSKELRLDRSRRDRFLGGGFVPTAQRLARSNVRTLGAFHVAISAARAFFFVCVGVILFVVPRFTTVPTEALIPFTLTMLYMQNALESMVEGWGEVRFGALALSRLEKEDLGQGLPTDLEGTASLRCGAAFRTLTLKGVSHRYRNELDDHPFTLGPIDLTFRAGELVFIVGGNGSGKTTLAKLLVGLYEPEHGEVLLDGEPITAANRETYRQLFSVVFSDFYLFSDLVGVRASELESQAQRYLEALQLHTKVTVKDGRLSTTALSAGQRKRLALLTAYLADRPVYLFDEWAADQDPQFKDVFYREILPDLKAGGKTVIVISHDDRYFGVADRVLKLDSGRLREDNPSPLSIAANA